MSAFDHKSCACFYPVFFVYYHPYLVRFIFIYCSILLLWLRYFIFFDIWVVGSVAVELRVGFLISSFVYFGELIYWILLFTFSSLSSTFFLCDGLLGLVTSMVLLIWVVLVTSIVLFSSYFYFEFDFLLSFLYREFVFLFECYDGGIILLSIDVIFLLLSSFFVWLLDSLFTLLFLLPF